MLGSIYELQQRHQGLPVVWAGDFRVGPSGPCSASGPRLTHHGS